MTTEVLAETAQAAHFGVSPGAVQRLYRLFESTPGLARVWIFGSRARGLHRPESDIDLAGRRQLSWPPGDNYLGRWEAGKFWCQLLRLMMLSLVSSEGLPASEASLA